MSIINQTLRELDARKGSSLRHAVPAPPAALPRRRRWAVVGGMLLLVVGGTAWLMSRSAEDAAPAPTLPPARVPLPPSPAGSAAPVQPVAALPVAAAPLAGAPDQGSPGKPAGLEPVPAEGRGVADRPEALPSLTMSAALAAPAIRKEIKGRTPEDQADELYRKAVMLVQKGREHQARPVLEEAVRLMPGHVAARQMLATLLSESGQAQEAEAVLRAGRLASPDNAWFPLGLARLQAARGDVEGAAATLSGGLEARGVTAEYRATLAALYLRLAQHPEAAQQYEQALRLQPGNGNWWIGLGLALEGQGRGSEARQAYSRALAAGDLPDKLVEFVRTKVAR